MCQCAALNDHKTKIYGGNGRASSLIAGGQLALKSCYRKIRLHVTVYDWLAGFVVAFSTSVVETLGSKLPL